MSRLVLYAATLAVVAGCSSAPAGSPSPTTTSSPTAAPPAPAPVVETVARQPIPGVTPIDVDMPTFAPVGMVGSMLFRRGGPVDTGIADVATYVNLRGTILVATTGGRLVTWHRGQVDEVGSFDRDASLQILTDRAASRAAILSDYVDDVPLIRVFDLATGRIVRELRQPAGATNLVLDTAALYYRVATRGVRAETLFRVDVATGRTREVEVDKARWFQDAVADHLVVFAPGGAHVRPLDDLTGGGRITLTGELLSPNLRWSVGPEGAYVADNTTRRLVRPDLPLPRHGDLEVEPYGWVGPDTVAFGSVLPDDSLDVSTCDVARGTCRPGFTIPSQGLVTPGYWSPRAE